MLKIQKMAEVVKAHGVRVYSQELNTETNKYEGKARKSFHAEELFWKSFDKNHPFVFSPINPIPLDLMEDSILNYESFDAPFEVFSIEVAGQHLTVAKNPSEFDVKISCIIVTKMAHSNTDNTGHFIFILYEAGGEPYVFMELVSTVTAKNDDGQINLMIFEDFDPGKGWAAIANNMFSTLIKQFVDRLNGTSTVGIENANINIHYRGRHDKRMKTSIKRIVHIVPKSARQNHKPLITRNIEWTHRFWRRGTWVSFYNEDGTINMNKIGKDRDGNYNVLGKTWRIESLVNADREDLPIVNKTRIVTE